MDNEFAGIVQYISQLAILILTADKFEVNICFFFFLFDERRIFLQEWTSI